MVMEILKTNFSFPNIYAGLKFFNNNQSFSDYLDMMYQWLVEGHDPDIPFTIIAVCSNHMCKQSIKTPLMAMN